MHEETKVLNQRSPEQQQAINTIIIQLAELDEKILDEATEAFEKIEEDGKVLLLGLDQIEMISSAQAGVAHATPVDFHECISPLVTLGRNWEQIYAMGKKYQSNPFEELGKLVDERDRLSNDLQDAVTV